MPIVVHYPGWFPGPAMVLRGLSFLFVRGLEGFYVALNTALNAVSEHVKTVRKFQDQGCPVGAVTMHMIEQSFHTEAFMRRLSKIVLQEEPVC